MSFYITKNELRLAAIIVIAILAAVLSECVKAEERSGCECPYITLGLGVLDPGHGWTREWPDAIPLVGYVDAGYAFRGGPELSLMHLSLPSEPDGGVWAVVLKKRWEWR